MHRPPAPLPDSLGSSFTWSEAISRGVTPARLRHRSLISPTRGLRLTEQDIELPGRAAAFVKVLPRGSAYSHHTAAELLGLPAPSATQLHVTVPDGARVRRRGVVEHRGMGRELGQIAGIPTTSPAQTWLDLASDLSLDKFVILGDAIMHAYPDHGSRLSHLTTQHPGARGIRRAREAITLIRAGVLSPQETLWRLRFREAGFDEPELNAEIHDTAGRWLGMVDFVWREQRVVVEYDGDYHFTVAQRRADQLRRRAMRAAGWTVIEINGADNRSPAAAMQAIARALGR
ncbi:endonuclease domain-containing protein [Flexivirga caeni]|uniref:DUF559 domain-containing protein n=1 Tax=Flexivirga caeni TaxID=2294115 RepID=A0A3M9M7Z1_9MICO|nr:DUF559 domain-containing protein [Flexivirga caeni]RNI21335.1 DUF559 domain-containing protein [Flexivirga caeni]